MFLVSSLLVLAIQLVALLLIYYTLRFLWELIPIRGLGTRAVFITGCDSGFGRRLALKCASNSIPVFAGCFSHQGLKALSAHAISLKGKLIAVLVDVTDDQSVGRAVKFVGENLNADEKLWALVNNAGIFSVYGLDDWCTVGDYQRALDVNTLGVIRVTNAFKPLLKQSHGRVITVTSIAGRIAYPGCGPYSVSKFATEAYMDTIRLELAMFKIFCSIIEPGIFKTTIMSKEAMDKQVQMAWDRLSDEGRAEYGENFKQLYCQRWNEVLESFSTAQVDYVIDHYYHAITARFPRRRYRCGWDSVLLHVPLTFLPTELLDFAIHHVFFWVTGWPMNRQRYIG